MASWIPTFVSSAATSLFASISVPSASPLAPSSLDGPLSLEDETSSNHDESEETLFRKSLEPSIAVEVVDEPVKEIASVASSVSVASPLPSIQVAPAVSMPPPPPPPTISLPPQSSEEDEDDSPPMFPLPNSHQRSSAPSMLPPPPPPSFSVSVTPPAALRSVHDEDDSSSGLGSELKSGGIKKGLETPTTTTKVIKARGKVALAPGHSPLDWARVKASGGYEGRSLKGDITHFPMRVTPSILKEHNGRNGTDAWSAYNGKVYNITPYIKFHPGGEKELLRTAGRDGTKLFMATHAWVNPDMMMDTCMVGFLVPE